MKTRSISKSIVCCFMACVAASLFFSTPNQADAQITYTVTGFTGLEGDVPGADVRSYTAVFEIDAAVTDSDNDPNRGEYTGAIISSSIVFDDGLVSSVDFAGGDVTVRPDFGGGGFFLIAPEGQGTFTLYSFSTLPSDALLLTPQVMDLPGILFFLEDETGLVVGYTDPEGGVVTGALAVSASPVLLGDCNFDGVVNFQDIDPFISSLSGDGYLTEADMNEDGDVTFSDIDGFINALSSN